MKKPMFYHYIKELVTNFFVEFKNAEKFLKVFLFGIVLMFTGAMFMVIPVFIALIMDIIYQLGANSLSFLEPVIWFGIWLFATSIAILGLTMIIHTLYQPYRKWKIEKGDKYR